MPNQSQQQHPHASYSPSTTSRSGASTGTTTSSHKPRRVVIRLYNHCWQLWSKLMMGRHRHHSRRPSTTLRALLAVGTLALILTLTGSVVHTTLWLYKHAQCFSREAGVVWHEGVAHVQHRACPAVNYPTVLQQEEKKKDGAATSKRAPQICLTTLSDGGGGGRNSTHCRLVAKSGPLSPLWQCGRPDVAQSPAVRPQARLRGAGQQRALAR